MYLLIINEAKSTKRCSVVAKHSNMKNLIFLLLCFAIHLASTSSLLSLKLEKSFTEDRRIDLKTDDDEALFLPEEEFTLCLHFKKSTQPLREEVSLRMTMLTMKSIYILEHFMGFAIG